VAGEAGERFSLVSAKERGAAGEAARGR